MAKIKRPTTPSVSENVEQLKGLTPPAGVQNAVCSHLDNEFSTFFKTLSMHLPYDPAVSLSDIYPKEMKAYVGAKPCAQMLTAAALS